MNQKVRRFLARELDGLTTQLLRHCCILQWVDVLDPPRNGADEQTRFDPQVRTRSAFLYASGDVLCLVTASHVIEDFEKLESAGRRPIRITLTAHLGPEPSLIPPQIPFGEFRALAKIVFNSEAIDIAFVPLSLLSARNLIEIDAKIPIGDAGLAQADDKFDFLMAAGSPEECNEQGPLRISGTTRTINTKFSIGGIVMLPAKRPSHAAKNTSNCIFAKVVDQYTNSHKGLLPLKSLRGVSGGPVFGLKINRKGCAIRLVGLQRGWYESDRIAIIEPLASIAPRIGPYVRAKIKESRKGLDPRPPVRLTHPLMKK